MPVKVLVVDDSPLIRVLIPRLLAEEPGLEVVGTAADGEEALRKITTLRPDVVTMDVEMPGMNGLAVLKRIMRESPRPVIMLSAHTTAGARDTMESLSSGAVDFVAKPGKQADVPLMALELRAKIKMAAKVVPRHHQEPPPQVPVPRTRAGRGDTELVVIGASTGGPPALQNVLALWPKSFTAAVVIVQHLPVGFSQSLADHLDKKTALEVRHAQDRDPVRPGLALVAPAGTDLLFRGTPGHYFVQVVPVPQPHPRGTFHPSVNGVMTSAAEVFGARAMGVLLTGMGKDGADGMGRIHASGGKTIAQDKDSCVVYGMPRAAVESGAVDRVVPLSQIGGAVLHQL